MAEQSRIHPTSTPENYDRFLGVVMAPIAAEIVRRAGVGAGATVLDVACGTGVSSRATAEVVGPTGRVVAVDLNAGMLAVARVASASAVPAIEWHEGSASALPLGDAQFDAVICNQGLQYFPDLAAAAREMARVVKRGAPLAASFWMSREHSPYQLAAANAARAVGGQLRAAFEGLGANDLGPDAAAAAFLASGWRDVVVKEARVSVTFPPLREFVPGHVMGLPVGPQFAALDDAQRVIFVDSVVGELTGYTHADGTSTVPFGTYVLTARRQE